MAKKEAAKTVETKTVNTGFVDNVEALEAKMKEMREAQKIFATFTQEQVDKIFYEAAMAANKQRIPLAKMAVEETQRGMQRSSAQRLRSRMRAQRTGNLQRCRRRYPQRADRK